MLGNLPWMTCLLTLLLPAALWGQSQGSISFSRGSFLSPDYNLTDTREFNYLSGRFSNSPGPAQSSGFFTDMELQLSPGVPVLSYLNPAEFYWKSPLFAQDQSLSLGRRRYTWSSLDERWGLGLFQPQFRWNPISPESQGMTGLFWQTANRKSQMPFSILLFASPFFVPDQGAGYEIENGTFAKSNPYFRTPPSQARLRGQTDAVNYSIEKPDTLDVVQNNSLAAEVQLGNPTQGIYFGTSLAYKPSNQLAMAFQGYISPNSSVEVQVLPAVYYHTLAAGDLGYASGNSKIGIGFIQETPIDPKYSSEWTYIKYSASQMVSPYLALDFRGVLTEVSYLKIQGAEESITGPMSGSATTLLPSRYSFGNAYALSVKGTLIRWQQNQLHAEAKYQRGERGEFNHWLGQLKILTRKDWSFALNFDFIAIDDSEASKKTLAEKYQNNDSIALGVGYVF